MLNRLTVLLIFWLFTSAGKIIDYPALYESLLSYANGRELFIIGTGIVTSLLVVLLSFIFSMAQWYALMYGLVRVFFELCQFFVAMVSLAAVISFLQVGRNFWLDLNSFAIVAIVALLASTISLRNFDFNYPVRNRLLSNIALMVISLVVVLILAGCGVRL